MAQQHDKIIVKIVDDEEDKKEEKTDVVVKEEESQDISTSTTTTIISTSCEQILFLGSPFVNLPGEVALHILSYLGWQDLLHCCALCASLRSLASDDALWREHLRSRFPRAAGYTHHRTERHLSAFIQQFQLARNWLANRHGPKRKLYSIDIRTRSAVCSAPDLQYFFAAGIGHEGALLAKVDFSSSSASLSSDANLAREIDPYDDYFGDELDDDFDVDDDSTEHRHVVTQAGTLLEPVLGINYGHQRVVAWQRANVEVFDAHTLRKSITISGLHTDRITNCYLSESTLLSCSWDHDIKITDLVTGTNQLCISGAHKRSHIHDVIQVGDVIISCGNDSNLAFYDRRSGSVVNQFRAREFRRPVGALAYSERFGKLAIGLRNGNLFLGDYQTLLSTKEHGVNVLKELPSAEKIGNMVEHIQVDDYKLLSVEERHYSLWNLADATQIACVELPTPSVCFDDERLYVADLFEGTYYHSYLFPPSHILKKDG